MITLRPLQVKFVSEVYAGLREVRSVVGVAPCGFGKRIVLAHIARNAAENGRRVIIATNRRILIEQMAAECKEHGIPYGVIMANEPRNDDALIQVVSIQTLRTRKWQDLPKADLLEIDEGHGPQKAYHELSSRYPNAKVLGVTATPVGAAGQTLLGLYDRVIEPVKNTELILGGWLLRTRVIAPYEPDMETIWFDKKGDRHKGVQISNSGEFSQEQLARVVESCTCFSDVFSYWRPYSGLQTLCIVPRVKYAYGMAEQFRERGFKTEVIEGGTTSRTRRETFASFADSDIRVIVGVDVPKEGLDLPIAQVGIDLQPCHQMRTYWQKLGRVRRPHGNQKEAIWLDFAGNLWRHGIHPDEDPPWSEIAGDRTTQDVLAERAGRRCKKCGSDQIENSHCRDCGADCTNSKKPWICSSCWHSLSPFERLIDGKCPNCGAKAGKQIRRIRMENGKMREVSADEVKRRRAKKDPEFPKGVLQGSNRIKYWHYCLAAAANRGQSCGVAARMYQRKMHEPPWNHRELPNMPDYRDWNKWVGDVFPEYVRRDRVGPGANSVAPSAGAGFSEDNVTGPSASGIRQPLTLQGVSTVQAGASVDNQPHAQRQLPEAGSQVEGVLMNAASIERTEAKKPWWKFW